MRAADLLSSGIANAGSLTSDVPGVEDVRIAVLHFVAHRERLQVAPIRGSMANVTVDPDIYESQGERCEEVFDGWMAFNVLPGRLGRNRQATDAATTRSPKNTPGTITPPLMITWTSPPSGFLPWGT